MRASADPLGEPRSITWSPVGTSCMAGRFHGCRSVGDHLDDEGVVPGCDLWAADRLTFAAAPLGRTQRERVGCAAGAQPRPRRLGAAVLGTSLGAERDASSRIACIGTA